MPLPLAVPIVMAVAGAAGAAISEYNKTSAAGKAKSAALANEAQVRAWADNLKKQVQDHYDSTRDLYGTEQDVKNYQDMARNTNFGDIFNEFYDLDGDGVADTENFSFDKTAGDYYNENSQKIIGDVMKKAQGSAAAAGMGRSYDGLNSMIQAGIDKDEQLWNDANTNYRADRGQAYSEWNGYMQQKNAQYQALVQAMAGDLSAAKDLATMYQTNAQNEFEDLMNADIAGQQAVQTAAQTTANTGNETFDWGKILTGGASAIPLFKYAGGS